MSERILFEEKQYLGDNKYSLLGRSVLVLFCFLAYYWSENPKPVDVSGIRIGSYPVNNIENSGQLFFIMGIIILVLSTVLIFVIHTRILITETTLSINGIWSARKVDIPLNSIVSVKKVRYSKYFSNRPVYNLHRKGRIRFYTRGNQAVELLDKDGLKYRIGTQKADELLQIIQSRITFS